MSILIECNRCGVITKLDYSETEGLTKAPLPPSWNILDGSHVCPACDGEFTKFMAQKRSR